ncbi:hypothetical protein MHU86_6317 [Fragilaria crotonensis]|nr:hypothetical protein MHU86_6317 [Fragilaria crotonensis]
MRILENNQISGDKLQNWMLQLQSGFMSLRRENVELRSEIAGIMQAMERGFQIVNGNMRRMALQPSRRRAVLTTATTTNANDGAENGEGTAADDVAAGERALLAPALAMTNPATLMPNPKVFTTCGLNIYTESGGESLQGCSPKLSEDGSSTSTPEGRLSGMWFVIS